jgi:hypothetical protein
MKLLIDISIVLISLMCATVLSGVIIGKIITRLLKSEPDAQLASAIKSGMGGVGKYIGWLERFLILCFIFIGYFQGIGFILAAKSILRYGEIKSDDDRRFAEYVIIGTMLSFVFAIVIGLLMRHLLGLPVFA